MSAKCEGCRNGDDFGVPFTMAFQPIVDIQSQQVFAYEALVRGLDGAGAAAVLDQVTDENRYAFDQACRVKAIELAARLSPADAPIRLSINFMPNAVYEPRACIRLTLATAQRLGFPTDRIIFEFVESEQIDTAHLHNILSTYKEIGFSTAIDDFGSGFAGIELLTLFQPDIVKLDMALVRGIDRDPVRRTIVQHTLHMLTDLGIEPLCEGIETPGELQALADMGVRLVQGYLLARPGFETLPQPLVMGFAGPRAGIGSERDISVAA